MGTRRRIAVVVAAVVGVSNANQFALTPGLPLAAQQAPRGPVGPAGLIPDSLLEFRQAKAMICAAERGQIDQAVEACTRAGLEVVSVYKPRGLLGCRWPAGTLNQSTFVKLANSGLFRYIEPAYRLYVPTLPKERVAPAALRPAVKSGCDPSDPYFSDQWGMRMVGAPQAWCTVKATGTVVAVLDTGVDWNHPDLKDLMWRRTGNLDVDDPQRFKDLEHGYDFYNDKPDPMDRDGHGTHCAGIIGAFADNGVGVAGIASRVWIMALKILDPGNENDGDPLAPVEAIDFAAKNGARVINASWYVRGEADKLRSLSDAIRDAGDKGVLFVAAAGNDGTDNDKSSLLYPASFRLPNVLTVASVDPAGQLSEFSCFGRTSVHLAAPGGTGLPLDGDDILSPISAINDGHAGNFAKDVRYRFLAGTSMAAPHVAGAAALILGHNDYKALGVKELRQLLLDKVRRLPSLQDACSSQGVLDISFLRNSKAVSQ